MTDEQDLCSNSVEALDVILLTAEQVEELDRRLEAYRKDQNPGLPWAEILRKIEE